MKIIQVTNTYKDDVLQIVESCVPEGFVIRTLPENTEKALLDCISDADYVLASGRVKINAAVLGQAEKLKMIQRTGVGLDSLDLPELQRRGIPLYVNKGVNSNSVAEHTVLLMLACLRRLPEISGNTKSGKWIKQAQGIKTRELGNCTVGVIGMGNIGRKVVGLLKPFGTKAYYYAPYRLSEEMETELGVTYLSCDELFGTVDIITMHCPLTAQTMEMVNRRTLSLAKDGIIVINTARGRLVNEGDLLTALQSNKVSFAGLDVFETEPPKNTKLLEHEHVIATPHIAGVTYDSFYQMMHDAMRNIKLFDEGKLQVIEQYQLKV